MDFLAKNMPYEAKQLEIMNMNMNYENKEYYDRNRTAKEAERGTLLFASRRRRNKLRWSTSG